MNKDVRIQKIQEIIERDKNRTDLLNHEIMWEKQLKTEKIWKQERYKEFYTQLTDVLRRYIHERYGVNSLEMTSEEILHIIRNKVEEDSVYVNLQQVLTIADLVKFAKHKPFIDQNDLSLMNSYFFINQTKEDDPLPDTSSEKKKEEADKNLLSEDKN